MLAEIGPLTFVCRRWGGSPRRPRMRLRYGTSGYSILERRRRKTSRGLARPVRESPMENSERSVHALRPEARALKWCTVPDCALVLCTRPPRDDTTACIRRFYRKIRDRKIRAGQKDSYRTGRFLPEEVSLVEDCGAARARDREGANAVDEPCRRRGQRGRRRSSNPRRQTGRAWLHSVEVATFPAAGAFTT